MMWIKYLVAISLIVICSLLQNSVFVYLGIFGFVPNLIFIIFFVFVFFEISEDPTFCFWITILSGFLLDVFSPLYISGGRQAFGVSMVAFSLVYFLSRMLGHFIKEIQDKTSVFHFIFSFLIAFLFYHLSVYVTSMVLKLNYRFNFNIEFVGTVLFNLAVALIVFWLYKKLFTNKRNENQLKLL